MEQFLHYHTDTAPGSSGSPVFNDQWEVVALHHSGVPRRDEQGHILKRGGGLWTEEMGEQWIDWIANEGIRISRLLPHLQQQARLMDQAAILDKELAARPNGTPLVSPQSPLSQPSKGNQATPTADPNGTPPTPPVPVITGNIATWTIPLQISIQLGQPTMPQATVQTIVHSGGKPSQPLVTTRAQQELQAALTELAAAPTRAYYDAALDTQDRAAYYAGLTDALTPEERFHTLHKLLSRTIGQISKYAPGRQLYPWVDLHQDYKIRSIYSNREYDPQAFIEEDFRIVEQRAARMNELLRNEAALSPDHLAVEFDALEAALPYNCEHVVCQSWFAKKEPMRGDLHHLFACEAGCNSFRGNTPYFDFPDYLEVIRGDCGKLEGKRFEPGNGKGKVARATLYFLLCYPGKINSVMPIYNEDRLQTLLDWHKQFPVTEHEKHRNMAIFLRQSNRNPLIDYPEWATQIDFRLGL